MGDYRRDNNRDSRSGGGRSFGGGGRSFDRERPQMHQATCSQCGKTCEVPFRPNGSKPVFCSDCFRQQNNQDSRRSDNRSYERPVFENHGERNDRTERNDFRPRQQEIPDYKAQFEAVNAKLDMILQMITPPPPAPLESEIDESIIEEALEEVIETPTKEKAARKKGSPKKNTSKKKAK